MRIEDQVAAGQFSSYERHAAQRLKARLPSTVLDDEIMAFLRWESFVAAGKFDASRGARFTTFLFSHLSRVSTEYVRNYYRECRNPDREVPLRSEEILAAGSPVASAEVSGLVANVSEPTGSILKLAMESNTSELRRAFGLRTWKHSTSEILGVSPSAMRDAVFELRAAIPNHLSSLEPR